ncbi:hypothetical protein P3L10_004765 [Capsicum annuum]
MVSLIGDSKIINIIPQRFQFFKSDFTTVVTRNMVSLESSSMISFRGVNGGKRSFFNSFDQEDNEADELGEYFHQEEKKRRLTDNQIQSLKPDRNG